MSLSPTWRRAPLTFDGPRLRLALWALACAPIAAAASGAPPAATAAGSRVDRSTSVTLVTGDRVELNAQGRVQGVRPGPGRRAVTFQTVRQGQDVFVTPADAAPLIRQGVVDPRLFNVSMLVRYGYDDARLATVPTIARGIGGHPLPAANRPRLAGLGVQSLRELGAVKALAGQVPKIRAHEFWNEVKSSGAGVRRGTAGAARLWLDGKRDMLLDQSVPQIGVPVAWARGLTGSGVRLAVLDSGLDAAHPDFAGRIVAAANFTSEPDTDTVGHGTHVTSIATGSGAASAGQYRGVAPDASLVVGKVCERYGCQESALLAGMQWAAETQRARVVNMSIGSMGTPDIDVLEEAVDNLSASTGVLFVISAGNSGCSSGGTIASPSTAQAALSVGAVDKADKIADFSSCGPRQGDYGVKPEITAPGVNIVAARSAASTLPAQGPGSAYTTLSGTSMASPHVAGVAVLLAQQHPTWTGAMIKAALIGSALAAADLGPFVQGSGRVDVPAALDQSALAGEPNAAFGVQLWPHADDALLRRTITFANTGAQPQVLNLAVQAAGSGGETLPPGLFYLGSSQVTVPAGGTASVDFFANTSVDVPDRVYAGQIVASTAGGSTKALFSVYKEPESYDLELTHLDRSGAPTPDYATQLIGLDAPASLYLYGAADGKAALRLLKGRYMLMSSFSDSTGSDTLFAPELNLQRDTRLTLDARTAKPWRTRVPDADAGVLFRQLSAERWNVPVGTAGFSALYFDPVTELRIGRVGNTRAPAEFAFNVMTYLGRAQDQYGSPDGRYPLTLALDRLPDVPQGWDRSFRAGELASITTHFPATATGYLSLVPETPGGDSLLALSLYPVDGQPLVTRVTRAPTMGWSHDMFLQAPGSSTFSDTALLLRVPARQYPPGREYVIDRRAAGPFSPTVNTSWSAYYRGPLPGQYFGDPASKLPPMLRRPSTTPGTDLMLINLSEFGATDGSTGMLFTPPGLPPKRLTISRNGVVEASADLVLSTATALPVAAVDGDYTLREEVPDTGKIGKALGLPPSSVTEWNFHSAKGTSQRWSVLPISVIRLGAPLAGPDDGTPGTTRRMMRFPLQVLRQAAPQPLPDDVRQLSVLVSTDSGATWKSALVSGGARGQWLVTAPRPAAGQTLSLKASAVSADGASVQQTLIDVLPPPAP